LRWAIAAVATAVVVAASALGFSALSSAKSSSAVLPWAPSDAIVYAEIRADMPGDQRANLLAFLSRFPGFADQTNFDAKADDGLDKLVKKLSDGKDDFSTDIKPWFGGQLGISVDGSDLTKPGVLVVGSLRDPIAAGTWLKTLEPSGATHETVGGIDVTEGGGDSSTTKAAWAIDGSVLLAGSVDTVKAAITRGPSGALANDSGFKAASAALGGDSLGGLYVNLKSYLKIVSDSESALLSEMGTGFAGAAASIAPMPTFNDALVPGWIGMRVRAESDHLVLDEAAPVVAGMNAQSSKTSSLAAVLPAGTVADYDLHDVGSQVNASLTQLESQPGGPTKAQVDSVLKYVGGADKAVGWLGDMDLALVNGASGFEGGIVAQTNDATASAGLFAELTNLASLQGSKAGITTKTETYHDQTITIFEADLAALTSTDGGGTPEPFSIAVAQANGLVIVGIGGDAFVKAVLDTKPGSSLADQAAYQRAIDLAGSSAASQGYVDLTAIRTAAESMAAGSSALNAYDSDVKPFVEPFQSLAWSQSNDGNLSTARIVLVLK
ncbi:MAG TPA: DUF3352 domain-containing protein, partial [Candidatus Limnocylindrales bacterium]|nr:DUF3352 domain-containing protein [Candidatus Limnocylindrales bacterium]